MSHTPTPYSVSGPVTRRVNVCLRVGMGGMKKGLWVEVLWTSFHKLYPILGTFQDENSLIWTISKNLSLVAFPTFKHDSRSFCFLISFLRPLYVLVFTSPGLDLSLGS